MNGISKILFSAMKNEGPFVLEWVAHHLAVGFDEIVIVSNDCDDGSAELLSALEVSGYLTHQLQIVPNGMAPQAAGVRLFEKTHKLDGKWVLWLDADEFLNVHAGDGSLEALITEMSPADGIAINWRVFGTCGMNIWQGENITQHQTGCANRDYRPHQAVKTLFRYGQNFIKMDVHAPHAASDREACFYLIDSGGLRIDQRSFLYDKNGQPQYRARMRNVLQPHKLAQINHYALRSRESFAFKSMRGDGTMTAAENINRDQNNKNAKFRHNPKFWKKYDISECRDESILRYQASTTQIMKEMIKHPEICSAYDRCCEIFFTNRKKLENQIGIDFASAKRWQFLSALGAQI